MENKAYINTLYEIQNSLFLVRQKSPVASNDADKAIRHVRECIDKLLEKANASMAETLVDAQD